MRCKRYYVSENNQCDVLPKYLEKDGFIVPCVPANFERLGILVRINATTDEGKTITQSHGELINGQWVEVIDEQLTNAEIEAVRQAAKSTALKTAENAYLTLLAGLTVTITAEDNSDTITEKLTASGMEKVDALEIGLKLLNAIHEVELQGGSWYDLPATLHNLEE